MWYIHHLLWTHLKLKTAVIYSLCPAGFLNMASEQQAAVLPAKVWKSFSTNMDFNMEVSSWSSPQINIDGCELRQIPLDHFFYLY